MCEHSARLKNLIMWSEKWTGCDETSWTGSGIVDREQHTFIYSGGETVERGVGLLLSSWVARCVSGYWPRFDRVMLVKLKVQSLDMAVVVMHAPTEQFEEEVLNTFYEQLLGVKNDRGQRWIDSCEAQDIIITNTWFRQNKRNLCTWRNPGDNYRS